MANIFLVSLQVLSSPTNRVFFGPCQFRLIIALPEDLLELPQYLHKALQVFQCIVSSLRNLPFQRQKIQTCFLLKVSNSITL